RTPEVEAFAKRIARDAEAFEKQVQDLAESLGITKINEELRQIEDARVELLGKQGFVTIEAKSVGRLPAQQRKERGAEVNRLKESIHQTIDALKLPLERAASVARIASERVDVTLPGRSGGRGTLHPLTRALDRIIEIFARLGYDVADGPEIEDD